MYQLRKALLALIFIVGMCSTSEAAARILVPGGASGSCTSVWSDTKCWAAVNTNCPGVTCVNGLAAPTSSDDVTMDTIYGSGTITIDPGGGANCLTLTMTSFAGTVAMSHAITIAGNLTLGSGETFTGASALSVTAASTLTNNGKSLNVPLTLGANVTYTLADDWTVTGLTTVAGAATATIAGTHNWNANGGLTFSQNSTVLAQGTGTTSVMMGATGTLTASMTTGHMNVNLEFNCSCTISASGTGFRYQAGTLKYTAGTLSWGTTPLTLSAAATIATNGSANMPIATLTIAAGAQSFTSTGTHGFTAATFNCLVVGIAMTFQSTATYAVTSTLAITATQASHSSWVATTPTSGYTFDLTGAANVAFAYVDMTDVTGVIPIYVFTDSTGTLTRTSNVTKGATIGNGQGGAHIIGGDL